MKFRVLLQRLALEDLREAYEWASRHAPHTAARWLDRFQDSLNTLGSNPHRCPLAYENGKVAVEVREFHFGKRPAVFRVIFTIEADAVRVLRIRRSQRRALTRRQIEEALQQED